MTLVRRDALDRVGGWAEWCICEDAELGLRLFKAGYHSVYVNRSFGRGLIPDSFMEYRNQRFRWAYGAVKILKRHWKSRSEARRVGKECVSTWRSRWSRSPEKKKIGIKRNYYIQQHKT